MGGGDKEGKCSGGDAKKKDGKCSGGGKCSGK